MLNELEKLKIYRAIMSAMKMEEGYNKSKNTLSAKGVLDLAFKRYLKMVEILEPLKLSLSKNMNITDIYFTKDVQNDAAIVVEYQDVDGKKFLVITEYDDNYIDGLYHTNGLDYQKLINDNKRIIDRIFKINNLYDFEYETLVPSTSRCFMITLGSNYYELCDKQENNLEIIYNFRENKEQKHVIELSRAQSSKKSINILLPKDGNIENLLNNIKVYEENIPKRLIKK